MTLAYIIYSTLLLYMTCSAWLYNRAVKSQQNIILAISIVVYSLVLGFRYEVGTDYVEYMNIYKFHYDLDRMEPGYRFLNILLSSLGFSFPSIFVLSVFLQIFFFYKGIINFKKILPWAIFLYFTTLYLFLSLNVLRQTIAFSFFVFSIQYIWKKDIWKYFICILAASCFHKSASILFPFYFFINKVFFQKRTFQILIFIITITASELLSGILWNNFSVLATIAGYGEYSDSINVLKNIEWSKEGGMGIYFWYMVDIWVILTYPKLKQQFNQQPFICFYNLYFIGINLANIIQGTYFDRINIYFQHCRIIVYAYFLLYMLSYNKKLSLKIVASVLVIVLIIFFLIGIHNKASMCAPFQFV